MTPSRKLLNAARGMAAIAAATPSAAERASRAYLALYACGYAGRGAPEAFDGLGAAVMDTAFLARLADRVPDRVTVSGWTARGWDDRHVFLEKDGIRTFVARARCTTNRFEQGQPVSFTLPALAPMRMRGFVMRSGAASLAGYPLSRLYLNLRPSAAAWVLGPLARALDRERLPFEMKVLAHPRAYRRRDAGVVYVPSARWRAAFAVVQRTRADAGVVLDAPVPLFTKKLARGIGFADDPADVYVDAQSHGRWVSRLFVRAAAATDAPLQIARAVLEAVAESGRDPGHPYLRPGRSASDTDL